MSDKVLSRHGQQWQSHLDRLFPHGVMMAWDGPVAERWQPGPRVVVQEMDGLDPVIRIPCYVMGKLVGPYRMESLEPTDKYGGHSYRAVLTGTARALILKAEVPQGIASEMSPVRDYFISQDQDREAS